MNKYQEALDRIGRNYYLSEESGDFEHFENLYLENKRILRELVDKATPKKPTVFMLWVDIYNFDCPLCENRVNKDEYYCPTCGQELDWSEDENK